MNKIKSKDLKQFGIIVAIIVLLNIIISWFFFRWDLTEDKRFSLGEPSQRLLKSLDEEILIQVYLHGDFPARFEKIEKATKDKLEEMKDAASKKIIIQFIDPFKIKNDSLKNYTFKALQQLGIDPMNITDFDNASSSEKIIFPGAVITYKGRMVGVNLVKGNVSMDSQDDSRIVQSISLLEYELMNGIKTALKGHRNKIAFTKGHGESTGKQLFSIGSELSKYSQITLLDLKSVNSIDSLMRFDLITIVKPIKPFSETEKFMLDQYLMKGGKLAFYLDMIDLRPDSSQKDKIIGVSRELNLTDMLFTYGARVNQTIIQDLQGSSFPIEVSKGNYSTQVNYFSPIISTYGQHQSVKYGKPVLFQDCSTVDTIQAEGILKTPLMFTSQYTKVNGGQIFFPVSEFMKPKEQSYFNRTSLPVTYLLEGKFKSNFEFKPVPEGFDRNSKLLIAQKESKIIVCSDGDFISNHVNPQTNEPLPLGINIYNKREVFSNIEVASGLFDYQLGDAEINTLRVKNIEKRPLDGIKIADSKVFWQIVNIGLPIFLVLALGFGLYIGRKRKYSKF